VSLQNLPIIFAIDRAGLTGPDGPTHHGVFDLAYLRPFPNFTVLAPADALDVEPMFDFAEHAKCPVAIRYPKAFAGSCESDLCPVVLGRAETIWTGADGAIAVCGPFLELANEVKKALGKNLDGLGHVDLGVINARFVKPLDTKTLLQPLRDGKFLITLEEGTLAGGFGSALLEVANEEGLDARKLKRIGIPDRYIEHGERLDLLQDLGFSEENLICLARNLAAK
jgi:1-deoxy-D-xylulose-5-phosphate synthase